MAFAALRERFAAYFPKGRIARRIITLASGTALAQIITICAMPIVTRLYTPAQVGVLSLFLSFFNFWVASLSLRYEYALLIAKSDAESHVVKRLALIVVVVMSVLGAPVLWVLNHTHVLGFGLLPAWVPLVAVPTLLGYGFFMVYRSWALRAGLIKSITTATMARSGANSGLQVIFGVFVLGVPGLFAAQVMGSWAAILKLFKNVQKHYFPGRPAHVTRSDVYAAARTFWKFAIFETPSTWVDQLALTLPVPLIAALHAQPRPAGLDWLA
ncbi:MAG TPA: hypothetical protein VJP80_01365 [Candidatus Saccharimonadales bacterium]|nr:hypothetical protein [Candidatus Saccharimonadales bacterium]